MGLKTTDPPCKVPIGAMFIWLTDTAPNGWLLCYGQEISRVNYGKLFALIGTTFGNGDGVNTFNLPDLRGRIPVGQDDMGGVSADRVTNAQADTIGGSEGAENHTLTIAETPSHNHTIKAGCTGTVADDIDKFEGTATDENMSTTSIGGGGSHNNVQPYLTTNYIIRC